MQIEADLLAVISYWYFQARQELEVTKQVYRCKIQILAY